MVRILAVADETSERLWNARVRELRPDLVVSAGDLPWDYLEFLASALDAPLLFVPGNHDPARSPGRAARSGLHLHAGMPVPDPRPRGGVDIDGRVVDVAGLRVAGLGGCVRYRPGPHQYSQDQYRWKAVRLARRVERADRLGRASRPRRTSPVGRVGPGGPFGPVDRDRAGIDLLVTHAPPRHCGDEEDRAHQGIEALTGLIDRLQPAVHVHGHIHPHGRPRPDRRLGRTLVRNVVPFAVFDLERRGRLDQPC